MRSKAVSFKPVLNSETLMETGVIPGCRYLHLDPSGPVVMSPYLQRCRIVRSHRKIWESRGGGCHWVRRTHMFGAIPDLSLSNDVEHYDVSQHFYSCMQNFCRWLASLWAMASVIFKHELKTRDIFANDQDPSCHFWCESFRITTRNNGFTTLHQKARHQSQPQFRGILPDPPPSNDSLPPSLPPLNSRLDSSLMGE